MTLCAISCNSLVRRFAIKNDTNSVGPFNFIKSFWGSSWVAQVLELNKILILLKIKYPSEYSYSMLVSSYWMVHFYLFLLCWLKLVEFWMRIKIKKVIYPFNSSSLLYITKSIMVISSINHFCWPSPRRTTACFISKRNFLKIRQWESH